jgi:hypothetical protein
MREASRRFLFPRGKSVPNILRPSGNIKQSTTNEYYGTLMLDRPWTNG